ncbi:MAG: hypothetical protein II694_00290, partial [Lachnospiraceae bacterium]|nr:hypothetical protein [Lachnospiraceae bacterium]
MKRLLALLLAAVMVLSVAGCKKGNDTKQTTEPTQVVTQATEPTKAPTEAPTATPEPESTKEPINPDDYCLKDVFAHHGMKIGTCISGNMIDRPAI